MTAHSDNRIAVVLFTGDAKREGRQKCLPPRLLSNLHRQLIRTIDRIPSTDIFRVYVAKGVSYLCDGTRSVELSRTGSLAFDVESALQETFSRGYGRVLLLAGDVCGLGESSIRNAIAQLETTQSTLVAGRSGDGGFYLAGFNQLPDIEWSKIHWFSSDAASSLVQEARTAGMIVAEVEQIDDIDDVRDAIKLSSQPIRGLWLAAQNLIRSFLMGASLSELADHATLREDLDRRAFQLPPPFPATH